MQIKQAFEGREFWSRCGTSSAHLHFKLIKEFIKQKSSYRKNA